MIITKKALPRRTFLRGAGAALALRGQGRSLLPAGVKDVQGAFDRGETDTGFCDFFGPATQLRP